MFDATVNCDTNLSREEILRLGKERPFYEFVSFPIDIKATLDAITGQEKE